MPSLERAGEIASATAAVAYDSFKNATGLTDGKVIVYGGMLLGIGVTAVVAPAVGAAMIGGGLVSLATLALASAVRRRAPSFDEAAVTFLVGSILGTLGAAAARGPAVAGATIGGIGTLARETRPAENPPSRPPVAAKSAPPPATPATPATKPERRSTPAPKSAGEASGPVRPEYARLRQALGALGEDRPDANGERAAAPVAAAVETPAPVRAESTRRASPEQPGRRATASSIGLTRALGAASD